MDDLRTGFEVENGDIISHVQAANSLPKKVKAVYSDRASKHDSYKRVFGWTAKSEYIKDHTIRRFEWIFF